MPTSTVSICTNHDESETIRNAAGLANMTVSAWAATRCVGALATKASRIALHHAVLILPVGDRRGRKGRISMVLQESDRDALRDYAASLNVSAHAVAQAAVISAARRELATVQPSEIRAIEAARRDAKIRSSVIASVPVDFVPLGTDMRELAGLVQALVTGTVRAIMAGKAQVIAEGALRLANGLDKDACITARLPMGDFELKAVAFVLGVPFEAVATAFVIKAAKMLGKAGQ